MKRKLDEKEKKITSKNVDRMKSEIEYLEYTKEYAELMLNKGLEQEFKNKRRVLEKQLVEIKNQIKEQQNIIDVLVDQLNNGVDVIEKKEPREV